MTLAIELSPATEQRLAEKARAAQLDLSTFLSRLLETEARRPTLREISLEISENFKQMNLTEDELAEKLEEEKHAARAARRGSLFAE
jgi:hypothetical protein